MLLFVRFILLLYRYQVIHLLSDDDEVFSLFQLDSVKIQDSSVCLYLFVYLD